tara:strand:+ start:419 stop:691 length:273 start_codon:yes stop_codon:yes gene_type:complete
LGSSKLPYFKFSKVTNDTKPKDNYSAKYALGPQIYCSTKMPLTQICDSMQGQNEATDEGLDYKWYYVSTLQTSNFIFTTNYIKYKSNNLA